MNLVYEDKYGAFSGVRPEFLKQFVPKEINPNFEVYDSIDSYNRFIAVKSSRIPDDEDLAGGRYGIDFNRAKPTLRQALDYEAELPDGYKWLGDISFAASTVDEYEEKSRVWDKFYSFIWDSKPQTIWVAPHSGRVYKIGSEIVPFPEHYIDTGSAGVAALCAFRNNNKEPKRVMIAVHCTGLLGAVLNLGSFGILNQAQMDAVAKSIEAKYRQKVQDIANLFKEDFCEKTKIILKSLSKKRGTLNPVELEKLSYDDYFAIRAYIKGLKYYGQEIKDYTLVEFERTLNNLGRIEVPAISTNYYYTGVNVGKLLKLSEKIEKGQMNSAVLIECARVYAKKQPELVAEMILDVKNELFG